MFVFASIVRARVKFERTKMMFMKSKKLSALLAAAASLSHATCTEGMKDLDACLALAKKYRPRPPIEREA